MPPDLSVIARSRAGGKGSGADYLYTYLRTFYRDDTQADRLEQPRLPERRACRTCCGSLQGAARAKFGDENRRRTGETVHKFRRLRAGHPGHDDAGRLRRSRRRPRRLPAMDGRAGAEHARAASASWVLIFLGILSVFAWRLNAVVLERRQVVTPPTRRGGQRQAKPAERVVRALALFMIFEEVVRP